MSSRLKSLIIVTGIVILGLFISQSLKAVDVVDWSDKLVTPVLGEVGPGMFALASAIEAQSRTGDDIYLVISSPGGSIEVGTIVVSAMEVAKSRGSRIHCMVPTIAASMAMIFLDHCTDRYAFPESFMLFHEGRTQAGGTAREMSDAAEQLRILTAQMEERLLKNLGCSKEFFTRHSQAETLWTGFEFNLAFPSYLKIIRDIKLPDAYPKNLYDMR